MVLLSARTLLAHARVIVMVAGIDTTGLHNTDGVITFASRDVISMHDEIASDDDNVAINEASRGVYVEFLVLHHGKGINIDSLGEAGMNDPIVTSVHFRDVLVDHCRYEACVTAFKGSKGKTLTQLVEKYPEKESYFRGE